MKLKEINWFALVGAVLLLALVPISLYFSWWRLIIGENLFAVNTSPVNTNFSLMGAPLTSPLVWAINVIGMLTLTASGIILLIYSVFPAKSFSMDLLSFGYRKPLYMVITYVVGLVVSTVLVQTFSGISVPVSGTSNVVLPSNLTMGANISVVVFSAFQWPFWLAIVAAGICIAARFYHRRVSFEAVNKAKTSDSPVIAPSCIQC